MSRERYNRHERRKGIAMIGPNERRVTEVAVMVAVIPTPPRWRGATRRQCNRASAARSPYAAGRMMEIRRHVAAGVNELPPLPAAQITATPP